MQENDDIFTEISERISKMLDYLSVKANFFAKKLGYERSQVIYDILNGKAKPSFDFFYKFLNSEYSDNINVDWLITGKGEMLKNMVNEQNATGPPLINKGKCEKCEQFQKIINIQELTIQAQADTIDTLKKLSEARLDDSAIMAKPGRVSAPDAHSNQNTIAKKQTKPELAATKH